MSKTPIKLWRNKKTFVVSAYINPNQDRNIFEELDFVGNVIQPDAPPPPPPPPGEGAILTDANGTKSFPTIQEAVDAAANPATILVKNGTYKSPVRGDDYAAVVRIVKDNITLKAYPGHSPKIDADTFQTWGIVIGDARANVPTPVKNTVIDGFEITGANRNGIRAYVPDGLIIRNCKVHTNNAGWWKYQVQSYEYNLEVFGSKGLLVEDCRFFNAPGINLYEDETVTALNGAKAPVIRRNFIYATANSGNPGNSSGIACRFIERGNIYDNVIYDACDAGINGLGVIHTKFFRNIVLNNWQPGGNNEGIKFCVRGGGNNTVANCLTAYNGNTGFDATTGVGDVLINNTVTKNDSWGLLMEGSNTLVLNTLAAGNYNTRNGELPNDFRPPNASGNEAIAAQTSFNAFGDSEHAITYYLEYVMPNTTYGYDPKFVGPWASFPRNSPTEVIHPEVYFGITDCTPAKVQALAATKFKSQAPVQGATLDQARALIAQAKDAALIKAKARIEEWKDSSQQDFQRLQAVEMWRRMVADIESGRVPYGELPEMKDMNGQAFIGTIGCVQ